MVVFMSGYLVPETRIAGSLKRCLDYLRMRKSYDFLEHATLDFLDRFPDLFGLPADEKSI